jgi:hypothetical protein
MSVSIPLNGQEESFSSGSEAADILDFKDDEGWDDAEPEDEQEKIISLLDDEVFPDVASMLAHCKSKYNFDLIHIKNKFALDFYGCIKLVNFIRSQVKNGQTVSSDMSQADFEADIYLKPVLEDDALLFSLDDLPDAVHTQDAACIDSVQVNSSAMLLSRIAELEEQLHKTQSQFLDYKSSVAKTLDNRWNENLPGASASNGSVAEDKRDDDSHYFNSYSYNGMSPRRFQASDTLSDVLQIYMKPCSKTLCVPMPIGTLFTITSISLLARSSWTSGAALEFLVFFVRKQAQLELLLSIIQQSLTKHVKISITTASLTKSPA